MNLYTEKLFNPAQQQDDLKQEELSWISSMFYDSVLMIGAPQH